MELLGQLVGAWLMCGQGLDTPLIVVSHPRAFASVPVCQRHRERELGGKGRIRCLPVSLFRYAWKVVKDGVQAEGAAN